MFDRLIQWRDDRLRLTELERQREEMEAELENPTEGRFGIKGTDAFNAAVASFFNEYNLIEAEIGEIETRRTINRAKRWQVPIPRRPMDPDKEDELWDWCQVHHRYYLSDRGKAFLRREAYIEMDLRFKPVLSWAAVAISIISLVVATLKT